MGQDSILGLLEQAQGDRENGAAGSEQSPMQGAGAVLNESYNNFN